MEVVPLLVSCLRKENLSNDLFAVMHHVAHMLLSF